ncbi:hypothetical protein M513_00426 [Trichuris suis]|uniref:Pyridoxal kinase n=1 Tax=Trichuris suis TaxID=68888 RepID=A0A085MND7_9BILA|nr:hypothetical protein M513_00426 [Trichuris suis]
MEDKQSEGNGNDCELPAVDNDQLQTSEADMTKQLKRIRPLLPPIVPSAFTESSGASASELSKELIKMGAVTSFFPPTDSSERGLPTPQLSNIVATVDMGCKLDLKKIVLRVRNAEYNPARFPAVILRIRDPRTTSLVFSTGKMVCVGARTEDMCHLACRKYVRIMQKLDFDAKFQDFKIENMTASFDMRFPIHLERLSLAHAQFCTYEPELFAGLVYRMVNPRVVLIIFVSGKVTILGAKSRKDLDEAFTNICPVLKSFPIKQYLYDEKAKIEGFHAKLTRLVQVKNGTVGIDVIFLVAPASCSSQRNVTMVQLYVSGCGDEFPWNKELRAMDNCTAIYSQPHRQLIKLECHVLGVGQLKELYEGLQLSDLLDYTHCLTGYVADQLVLEEICKIVSDLRKRNPELIYVCDPVMGDNGRFVNYVSKSLLTTYADELVPMADIITPNQFELEVLTEVKVKCEDDVILAMKKLLNTVPKVVVTSTELDVNSNKLCGYFGERSDGDRLVFHKFEVERFEERFVGTGDLFSSLLLVWLHKSNGCLVTAVSKAQASVQDVLKLTRNHSRQIHPYGELTPKSLELRIVQSKNHLISPKSSVKIIPKKIDL